MDAVLCEHLLKNIKNLNADVTSSLNEEINTIFCGKSVIDIKTIDFQKYEFILITPIGYNEKIIKHFPVKIRNKLNWIISTEKDNQTIFSYEYL